MSFFDGVSVYSPDYDYGFCSLAISYTTYFAKQKCFHTGLIHKDENNERLIFLHLGSDNALTQGPPLSDSVIIKPKLTQRKLRQVASFCRLVYKVNGRRVPYAFSDPRGAIDRQTGRVLSGPNHLGLTCASFVLAVFDALKLSLIEYDTWPPRESDTAFQEEYIQSYISPQRRDEVRGEIGSSRR